MPEPDEPRPVDVDEPKDPDPKREDAPGPHPDHEPRSHLSGRVRPLVVFIGVTLVAVPAFFIGLFIGRKRHDG